MENMTPARLWIAVALCALVPAPVLATTCYWSGPSGGYWDSTSNWSGSSGGSCGGYPAKFPNNTTTDKYSAAVTDMMGGDRIAVLRSPITVGNDGNNPLRIGTGYTLRFNGNTLNIENGSNNVLHNLGTMDLTTGALVFRGGSGTTAVIRNSNSTTDSRPGAIKLGSDTARISGAGGTLQIDRSQAISGFGQLGANTLDIILLGYSSSYVAIDATGGVLIVDPAATLKNYYGSVLQASDTGTLRLADGTYNNFGGVGRGGTIQANNGGTVMVDASVVINGGYVNINSGGLLQLSGATLNANGVNNTVDAMVIVNFQGGRIAVVNGVNTISSIATAYTDPISFTNAGLLAIATGASLTMRDTTILGSATWRNHDAAGNGGAIENSGELNFDLGSRSFDNEGGVIRVNSGAVTNITSGTVSGGTIDIKSGGRVNVTGSGAILFVDMMTVDGVLALGLGEGTLNLDGGDLNGSGQIQGSVNATNGGTVTGNLNITNDLTMGANSVLAIGNSPGTMHVGGDFAMTPSAIWNVEVVSEADYDRLVVGGTANLGGTLNIFLDPGFVVRPGMQFTLLSALAIAGQFDFVNLPDLTWHIVYNSGSVVLESAADAPEPGAFALLAAGLLLLVVKRRRA
jgi:hypothetical protein